MRHKIRHRKRKCVTLSTIFPISKPKQPFTVPREAHQLGFRDFFIHHSRPPSFSQYHNSYPGGHNNRGAPDHNHRFANGSQSDRRGFLSNSEYLSQILRFSRQMTSQNGPNTEFRGHEAVLPQETATNRRQTQDTSPTEPSFCVIRRHKNSGARSTHDVTHERSRPRPHRRAG